jgi:hypothetical protein
MFKIFDGFNYYWYFHFFSFLFFSFIFFSLTFNFSIDKDLDGVNINFFNVFLCSASCKYDPDYLIKNTQILSRRFIYPNWKKAEIDKVVALKKKYKLPFQENVLSPPMNSQGYDG